MAGHQIADFEVDKLRGTASFDGRAVVAVLDGTASHRDVVALEDFLAATLREAARVMALHIVVDLRAVAYMNSSHFKALVGWLGRVGKARPRIGVRLLGNPAYHWQKRSLDALRHLAEEWVAIET